MKLIRMDVQSTWMLWQGKNCPQFSLLTLKSFICQFIRPVGREGDGIKGVEVGITILARCMFNNMVVSPLFSLK